MAATPGLACVVTPPIEAGGAVDILYECFCASVCKRSVVKRWQYVQTDAQRPI